MGSSWLLRSAFLLALTIIAPITDEPRVLWVDVGACPRTGTGTESDPFCSIQTAYDFSADGDEIRVRAGTYEECIRANDPASPKSVHLIADAFDVAEPDSAGLTTIDGSDVPGCAPYDYMDPTSIPPEVPVVELGGAGSSLSGFRITGGGETGVKALGSVTISHNLIENNERVAAGGLAVITSNCIYGDTETFISHNVIRGNYAAIGGGIWARAGRDRFANPPDTICPDEGDARVTISDNVVTQNSSTTSGAGIEVRTFAAAGFSADVVITRNTISENISPPPWWGSGWYGYGAGIYAISYGAGQETIVISENTIEDNYALSAGGGISAAAFTRANNDAVDHRIEIEGNLIRRNRAGYSGGGIEIGVGGADITEPKRLSVVARENLLEANAVTGERSFAYAQPGGGGVSLVAGANRSSKSAVFMQLVNNRIIENSAQFNGGGLSALAWAESGLDESGELVPANGRLEIVGNLIAGNESRHPQIDGRGGGAHLEVSSYDEHAETEIEFALNTVVANSVDTEFTGGGVQIDSGTYYPDPESTIGAGRVQLTSNIIANNQGIGVDVIPPELPAPETRGYGTNLVVDVSFSDVVNNSGGNYGEWMGDLTGIDGNVSIDPGFVDPAAADFHIAGDSAVVDAGDPGPPQATPATDQDGDPRVVDGNLDGVPVVDMGYDEWVPPVIEVVIDVKPDDEGNMVNPRSRGVIPVALFGSTDLDVATIDTTTLRFGPDGATPAHGSNGPDGASGHFEDVDLDGVLDLMIHFRTQETGIVCGDTSANLVGMTREGNVLRGTDPISTVGCTSGGRDRGLLDGKSARERSNGTGPVQPERR